MAIIDQHMWIVNQIPDAIRIPAATPIETARICRGCTFSFRISAANGKIMMLVSWFITAAFEAHVYFMPRVQRTVQA